MIYATDIASKKIKKLLDSRKNSLGIRIGVKTTGCSGLAYVLEYADTELPNDLKIESNGCIIFIDPKHIVYFEGMTIDFVKKGLNEGFEFINPNESARCGCGESFSI
jgi:iron-sulfur cluster assembly protein